MLSAQGDGRQPHNPTYLGLSPTVSLVLGPCLSPSSHFPFCHLNNFIFICPSASETPRLCRKACLAYLPRLKTEFLVAALTSSLPDLDRLPLLHFVQKVSSSSPMPRRCPGKVRAKSELSLSRPQDREHLATCLVGSPGARRLWTDWLPLRKKEGKKIPILLPLAANVSKYGVHQRGMLTYPPSPYAHLSSHQHRSRGDFQLPWHRLPLSLPVANFANEIKQTNVSFVCQKWCSGLCGEERKKKKSMQP